MLCDQCQQREASVFLTQVMDGQTRESNLCEVCGDDIVKLATKQQPPSEQFATLFARLAATDQRYAALAYPFVYRAVARAFSAGQPPSHLPASAIANAFRELALAEFGTEALGTLAGWGIHSCADLGAIIFQLIEARLLGSQTGETTEDFANLYDFATVFPTDV